jgi:uncharacterized protein YjbI with pentapeptide repeats
MSSYRSSKSKKVCFEMLCHGVKEWNSWRVENPHIVPVLGKVDFSGWDLSGANFRNVEFSLTKFRGANLTGADFSRSILFQVKFDEANLQDACFFRCDLTGSNFVRANLQGANFSRSKLVYVHFYNAYMNWVNMNYADLSFACLADVKYLRNASFIGVISTGTKTRRTNFGGADL